MSVIDNIKNKQEEKFRRKHKIGLCLSGGGTKGISFIGAFMAFEEYGIKFDAVAGTSVGSLFAALYASNMNVEQMCECAKLVKTSDFRKSKLGFLPSKMDNLHKTISTVLPIKKAENLKIPYYAIAVDLKSGKEVCFDSGNLASIITGSCSIPGVFCPVKYRGMTLIDGGVANNIPVDVLKSKGYDVVITIDCNATRGGGTKSENIVTQFVTSVGIMMANNSKKGLELSDLIISPNLEKFNSLKLEDKEEMIKEGYKATLELMPQIKKVLKGKIKR